MVYLFYYHNYEEFIIIDLKIELKKGYRSYSIPQLFSKVRMISPVDNELIDPSSVQFYWEGIQGNQYELIYSTDSTFSKYASVLHPGDPENPESPPLLYLLAGLPIILYPYRNKVRSRVIPLFALVLILINLLCDKQDPNGEDPVIINFSETVIGLEQGARYFWKIKAFGPQGDNFYSQTITRSFITKTVE